MGDHAQMCWNAAAGRTPVSWGNELVESTYSHLGGYVPGDSSTDNGLVIQDFLSYWRHEGIGGSKISFYGALRPVTWQRANRLRALQAAGGLLIGLALPVSAEEQFPGDWTEVPGSPVAGGHAVFQSGELRTLDEVRLVSWGAVVHASKAFVMDNCDEAWVAFGPDFTEKDGTNPSGMDLQAVNTALASLTGEINPLGLRSIIAVPDLSGVSMTQPDEAINEQADDKDAEIAKLRAELAAAGEAAAASAEAPGLPETMAQHQPEPAEFSGAALKSASNQTATLPGSAETAAMKAHGMFTHLITFAQAAQAEIERYVPASVVQGAEDEAAKMIRTILSGA
jgi:hypothetical protein